MLFVGDICRLTVLFSSVATFSASFIPTSLTKSGNLVRASDGQNVQAPANTTAPFDPDRPELSHCQIVQGMAGQWPLIGPRLRPFIELVQDDMPDARDDSDAAEKNRSQPLSAISQKMGRPNLGVETTAIANPQTSSEAFCVELKQATIDVGPSVQGGFLRARDPADINTDQDRRYWLIWDIHGPHEITVYSRSTGKGQLWHRDLVSSSPMSHTGHTSYMGHPRQLKFDVSLTPQGANGTVTVFAVNTFKSG